MQKVLDKNVKHYYYTNMNYIFIDASKKEAMQIINGYGLKVSSVDNVDDMVETVWSKSDCDVVVLKHELASKKGRKNYLVGLKI